MLAILLLAPSTRRFSLRIPFKLVDRVDLGLHVGGGALHLNRDRMHQRFERSRIIREPGDELARLRRSWNHNFPREPLNRQIGGIEDVAMRVDDAVDPRRHGLRPGRYWERGFASRQRDATCDKFTPTHGLPHPDASEGYLALPDCPGLLRLRRGTAKRPDTQTGARESIRIFLEHQVDAAVPGTMKFCQELFGRRDTARDIFLNRAQIACLILSASTIVALARCSTSRPAILAAKPSFGTSSRSFWRCSAVQFLTRSHAASSESSS